MKKILILVLIIFSLSLFAGYKDIPVTRDLDPNTRYDTYGEWLTSHPQQHTQYQEIGRMSSTQREDGFLIIVNTDLYEEISQSLQTYQEDLANEGFDSFVVEFDGTSAFDLKIQILIYVQTEDISNCVLIGDLPTAWFELFEDWNNNGIQDEDEEWVEFPCDLYFTDLDGTWDDLDENGVYDYHEGEKHPEIGLGRIVANNMSLLPESEADLINTYFYRNHLFRTGIIINHETSLAYIDDDWAYWGPEYQQAMQLAYPSVELVSDIEETNAGDYRDNRLIYDYEFIQVHVHSGPNAHYFYYNNGNSHELVNNFEIPGINPTAHFYNLFCCSNSRYTTSNNMGGMYIYGDDHGLATLGSTKTGSMLGFSDFYQPFGSDETLGESLRLWWENNVDTGPDWQWERAWFYGMIVQGDPSLLREYEQGNVIYIPQNYPTIQEGIDAADNGFTIFADDGIYQENITIDGKDIILQSIDGAENCIIDGESNDTVLKIQNTDDTVIKGFTIQNGLASYGGGIFLSDCNSITLDDINIENNIGIYRGGNLYISNSNLVFKNSNVIGGAAFNNGGGGIYCINNSIMDIDNVNFENNSGSFHGGLFAVASDVHLSDCIFYSNIGEYGGALSVLSSNAVISNCLFYENSCITGGILHSVSSNTVVINSTICNNSAQETYGGISGYDNNFILINSIIWDNTEPQLSSDVSAYFCNVQGGREGEGNIDENPCFMGQSYGDFSITGFSPCIGAGIDEIEMEGITYQAPLFDLDGNPRPDPVGSNPDIGAYEHHNGEPYVSTENELQVVPDYSLCNYPNPFNPSTIISFSLPSENNENIKLGIYNLKGQKVKQYSILDNQSSITWNGANENEQPVSSGLYFYRISIDGNTVANKKMLLLK